MHTKAIIHEILDGRLSPAEKERRVELLMQNPQLTEELLYQHRLDLALHAFYGTRNRSLEAAVMASITGSSDERLRVRTMKEIKRYSRPRQSIIRRWVMPLAAAAALILGFGFYLQSPRDTLSSPVAVLASSTDAVWAGPMDPSIEVFTSETWKLISGVAELRTTDGATVTLQGPAEFTWRSARLMNLESGLLLAHVPPQASGFTVQTPAGRVVDIGTRFGVSTGPAIPTETHVFEGHVQVKPARVFDSSLSDLRTGKALVLDPATRKSRRMAADPSRFPQPSVIEKNLLIGGEWEPGDPKRSLGIPHRFGVWGGDYAEVIGDWKGVKPHRGKGMLRLISSTTSPKPKDIYTGHEQWQFVNLESFADEINKGSVVVEASMWIRQVGGAPVSYRLILTGFQENVSFQDPTLGTMEHPGMTALSIEQAMGAPQATQWRQILTRLELPPGTRFIYVNPRAGIGSKPDPDVGILIDSVELNLLIPPRAASGKE